MMPSPTMAAAAMRPRRRITAPPSAVSSRAPSRGPSRAAEESGRPERQDHRHGSEEGEVGELRKERLPEIVEKTNDEAAHHRAGQAPEPADDHHHESIGQHLGIRARVHAEEAGAD